MKRALTVAALTGLVWSFLAVRLMGGRFEDLHIPFLIAGITAGIAAGVHTIRTRKKKGGDEGILAGIACYYLAIVIYWAVWLVAERVSMCIELRKWTDFDLHDHLNLIWVYLFYGTIPYGLLLIPLCFLNRWVVWRAYTFKR
ncbi:MAG: hypothetical protein JF599_13505 [Verrucomicrobia bacterium]|nr:hypothetical protein [Verrucomicrobiota bacterium]